MQEIDEARLEQDLAYRFEYLAGFIEFGEEDVAAIHDAAGYLAPVVPQLVDAVYDKLAQYDATWRHFVPRQDGYKGQLAESVESLQMSDEVIQFRKQHLARYLEAHAALRQQNGRLPGPSRRDAHAYKRQQCAQRAAGADERIVGFRLRCDHCDSLRFGLGFNYANTHPPGLQQASLAAKRLDQPSLRV